MDVCIFNSLETTLAFWINISNKTSSDLNLEIVHSRRFLNKMGLHRSGLIPYDGVRAGLARSVVGGGGYHCVLTRTERAGPCALRIEALECAKTGLESA